MQRHGSGLTSDDLYCIAVGNLCGSGAFVEAVGSWCLLERERAAAFCFFVHSNVKTTSLFLVGIFKTLESHPLLHPHDFVLYPLMIFMIIHLSIYLYKIIPVEQFSSNLQ